MLCIRLYDNNYIYIITLLRVVNDQCGIKDHRPSRMDVLLGRMETEYYNMRNILICLSVQILACENINQDNLYACQM